MIHTDTIAAIATAMGNSGIGVVRISGQEAVAVAARIFKEKGKQETLEGAPSHTIHYGYIYDGDQVVDEVLVMLMRGPRSFTAEDTVEIDCHGGMLVTRRILETVLKAGARLAEPGEFTKRAFLNGRIDLSQAEAVIDVINAKNEYALKSSVGQLRGSVSKKIRELREKILYEIAFIESALDDPEHISLDGYGERLLIGVQKMEQELSRLIRSSANGRVVSEGIRTVILGKPNAGKSSLMNVLVGEDRAIVTDIAGTTRDILEEHIYLQGISLTVGDTAGIRSTSDVVEKIGVERAMEAARDADLIIYVVDGSRELDENDLQIMELIRELQEKMGTSVILVTHDLGIAAEVGDRIQVMYAGEIIETGTKSEIFKKAVHPYTWALMKSVPSAQSQTEEKLYSLKGTPPDLIAPPKACAFAPRCEYCMGICRRMHPVMAAESESHSAGCWLMHPDAPKPERLGKGGTI